MLLDPQYHHGLRIQLDAVAVGALFQHLLAEGCLDHRTVGGDAFAAFTAERRGGLHFQAQVLGRLNQVGCLECRILELLGRLDEALLHLLGLQFVGQLVLQAGKARHVRCLNAKQLDQVIAELGAHRGGHLILVQLVQRVLEGRVVHTWAGKAEVTACIGGARVLGELLGQLGKVLALFQALLDFLNAGLGLGIGGLVVDLDQDVRGMALLAKVGDFLLVQRLELVVVDLDLVEEGRLLQLDVVDDHLVRGHELLGVLVIVRLDFLIAHLDRGRVGLEGQRGEVTGLLLQTREGFDLLVGDEAAAGQTGAQLADEHFLSEHLAELHAPVAHLADDRVEALGAELAIDLEFRRLQDQLIQRSLGESELGVFGALQQQLAIDQPLERGFAQHLFVQQRRVEILAQLLHQLAALHVDGLAQLVLADGLAVYLGGVLAMGGGLEDGFEAGQRHEHDDEANDGLGNPTL